VDRRKAKRLEQNEAVNQGKDAHRGEHGHVYRIRVVKVEAASERELDLLRRVPLVEAVLFVPEAREGEVRAREVTPLTCERMMTVGMDPSERTI
jgi:hypothetical protein